MFYQPRFSESYVMRRFLGGDGARNEAESLFHKGVLFGEPQGSADEQKRTLQNYYRFMLGLQTGRYRDINGGGAPDSIFEAGCSVGWYLKVARDEFLVGSKIAQGCDANRFAAAKARSGFGLDVFAGTLRDYPLQDWQRNRFHLVAALDFIEHTYTPRDDLSKLFDMAAPGGVLMLKTFLHELDCQGSYVHPVFHVHHFTRETLQRTVGSAGWKILEFDDQRERSLAQVTVLAHKP
jgi:SAM-dependent methyltransferase